MPHAPRTVFALLVVAALASATAAHAAWPTDASSGVPVSTATTDQSFPQIAADGAGGTIIVWRDTRSGTNDIYAQRLNSLGVPQWTADGIALCNATSEQIQPLIVSDGSGGAIVAWSDARSGQYDVYAQRVNASGTTLWAFNGVPIVTAATTQILTTMFSDGATGAILGWYDGRSGNNDVYAQWIKSNGVVQWTANGVLVGTAAFDQYGLVGVVDGAGGALFAWNDTRTGTNSDVYGQHVTDTGAILWGAGGQVVSNGPGEQSSPAIVSDGAGGMIVAWQDTRSGSNDVYSQRMNGSGFALWTNNGAVVCNASLEQTNPKLVSDGMSGALIAWTDGRNTNSDIYAQRMNTSGVGAWGTNGIGVCFNPADQYIGGVVSDGSKGMFVYWGDTRSGSLDVYANRVTNGGLVMWNYDGVPVVSAANHQYSPVAAADGAGGAVFAWYDLRGVFTYDVYATRLEHYGYVGNPEPSITRVGDVKNDQGGSVKVSWNAGYPDADPLYSVYDYRLWRSVPATLAARAALTRGVTSDPDDAAKYDRLLMRDAVLGYAWEAVGTQAANGLASYSMVAATTSDSVPGSNPFTVFMVEARTGTLPTTPHWFSAADSGYSVDNLPPGPPAPFAGTYSNGSAALHWRANSEADLANYRLYRGTSAGFVPSIANRIAAPVDTALVDAAAAPFWYKVSAVDAHGNESAFTTLLPAGALDAPGAEPHALELERPSPNPAAGTTMLRFALPRDGRASLAVYDAAGRCVRTLVSGEQASGPHAIAWDLRGDDGAALGAGLYFVRLVAAGETRMQRMATLR